MDLALSCPRCGLSRAVELNQADFGIRCDACDAFMDVDRSRPPRPTREHVPEAVGPWTPWQVVAAPVLFGPVVGGAVVGFNFARLGKRRHLIPYVAAGWVLLAAALAVVMFLVPGEAAPLAGPLANLALIQVSR